MMQRILTGIGLLCLLVFALWMSGWVLAVLWIACVLIAVAEEFVALTAAGHRLVTWPTWLALLVSIPAFLSFDDLGAVGVLIAVTFVTFLLVSAIVIFRKEPHLEDLVMSLLPLLSVALPGLCMLAMVRLPINLQRMLLALSFLVPVVGDTFAYFVGIRWGRVKLSPVVSPKKTVEGALGGLLGSTVTGVVTYLVVFTLGFSPPGILHFVLIGLLGGVVGQLGDLFASLVKRHCNVKDFGTIFPGHGGMMDRLDSVLFVSVFVYAYNLLVF